MFKKRGLYPFQRMGDKRMPIDHAPQAIPVTSECITAVNNIYSFPENLIYSIIAVEGGVVGRKTGNTIKAKCQRGKNCESNLKHSKENRISSYDIGPMQVNSRHLRKLNTVDVDEITLMNNGCINIAIGAAILNGYIEKKGDLWGGVGRYNASDRSPDKQKIYSDNVAKKMMLLTNKKKQNIINRANRLMIEMPIKKPELTND